MVTKALTTKGAGDAAEALALAHLQGHGLALVKRNYRVARGPRARGGEVDLILRDRDGTLVFVEVRARRSDRYGGAAASVDLAKQRRLVFAARCFLLGFLRHRPAASTSSRSMASGSNGCRPRSTRPDARR